MSHFIFSHLLLKMIINRAVILKQTDFFFFPLAALFVVVHRLSPVAVCRGFSVCRAWALEHGSISNCGAQA